MPKIAGGGQASQLVRNQRLRGFSGGQVQYEAQTDHLSHAKFAGIREDKDANQSGKFCARPVNRLNVVAVVAVEGVLTQC
jgi:hypothetical protein